jgi:hypothetical protein
MYSPFQIFFFTFSAVLFSLQLAPPPPPPRTHLSPTKRIAPHPPCLWRRGEKDRPSNLSVYVHMSGGWNVTVYYDCVEPVSSVMLFPLMFLYKPATSQEKNDLFYTPLRFSLISGVHNTVGQLAACPQLSPPPPPPRAAYPPPPPQSIVQIGWYSSPL